MTRLYLDTEFLERGHEHPIQLISIGLVREDGQEFYAVCRDGWRLEDCSDWLFENVIPHLDGPWMERDLLVLKLKEWLGLSAADKQPKYEVYGYFADYDWVLVAQLFGRMVDLPKGLPMFCRDIKQTMDEMGLKRSDFPKQEGVAHNAIEDARHIKLMHERILKLKAGIS